MSQHVAAVPVPYIVLIVFLLSKLEDSDTLDRVLLYCQATAGLMMIELHKLSSENLLIKAGDYGLDH